MKNPKMRVRIDGDDFKMVKFSLLNNASKEEVIGDH